MSSVSTSSIPASPASRCAPATPPAGPDSRLGTGAAAIASEPSTPPELVRIDSRPGASPRWRSRSSSSARCARITGATYAAIAVVEVRSYSRCTGSTSLERNTASAPPSRSTISRARCSCSGFSKANRNTIASERTPAPRSRRHAARTPSSSSGTTTSPSASIRSVTSRRRSRGTSGSGICSSRSNSRERCVRRISSTSRNPRVVISPVRAPVRVSTALTPSVVPTFTCETSFSATPVVAIASSTPLAGSRALVGTFSQEVDPLASSSTTTSVKVPPTSTPIRIIGTQLAVGEASGK